MSSDQQVFYFRLNDDRPSVIVLSVIMLSVIMLNVMLRAIRLNVVAPV